VLDGGVPPITLAALRLGIGLIPLIVFLTLKKGWKGVIKPLKEDWKLFVCLGVIGIVLPNLFQNYGMIWTEANLSSIIQSSAPIFTILLAVVLLHEPLGINKVFGATLALSGSLLLVTEGGMSFGGSKFIGNFLILMSAVSYSFSSILGKKMMEKHDPFTITILSMVIGGIILAVFSFFEHPQEHVPHLSNYHWSLIVILAILPGSLALLIWYTVLKSTEVSKLILFIYLIPVFATVISYLSPLREIITLKTVLFALLIVCGVMIAQFNKSRKPKTGG
jgi:drug/metabolite transporter (DMT)-like permease